MIPLNLFHCYDKNSLLQTFQLFTGWIKPMQGKTNTTNYKLLWTDVGLLDSVNDVCTFLASHVYITWGLCERRNFPWYRKRFNLIELELSTTTSNFVTRLCFPSSFLAAKASCQYGTIWKAVSFNYSLSMAWMVYSAPLLNYKKRWKLVEKVKSALTVLACIVLDNIWIEKKQKKLHQPKLGSHFWWK